jgi:hypothetical protein
MVKASVRQEGDRTPWWNFAHRLALTRLDSRLVDGADLWRSFIDSIGLSADDITGECPWQRLVVGKLQLLMDGSLSQDENSAIPTFSKVSYITKLIRYEQCT